MTRLEQLAEGNYLVVFSASGSAIEEALLIVVAKIPTSEDGSAQVLRCAGLKKSAYGSWEPVNLSISVDDQKLRFSPISQMEAKIWLQNQGAEKAITSSKASAALALEKAELQHMMVNVLLGNEQLFLEGEKVNA